MQLIFFVGVFMLRFCRGDILGSDCEALINPVNCRGKMGRGLALLYKRAFPKMFLAYKRACAEGKVKVGRMHIWRGSERKWVINFPTKDHWRDMSKLEWIVLGLGDLVRVVKEEGIMSLALPQLGCGLGGLHWYQVRGEIKRVHDRSWRDIRVVVFET
jgi:O-acetyl-ADP-ribose deacetylase (regulator of RNase III)